MGFPKTKATAILKAVFNTGNKIALLTAVSGDSYTEVSGTKDSNGYERYTIKASDFSTTNGVTTSADNILFGLALESWGTVVGIAVFSGSSLEYLAELKVPKMVAEDTVPVFKKYNEADEEGIKVTLDVVTAASASVTGTT